MLKNYVIIALRNLMRNKLYSLINIGGLALGLAVFIFAAILSNYEKSHDVFFEKSDRIYTLGSKISPNTSYRVNRFNGVYTAMTPLLRAEVPDIESIARIVQDEYLLTIGENKSYQDIKFVDKEFLAIFDFEYIAGDSTALDDPAGAVLTETMARKFFPDGNAMGKVISLSFHSKADVRVTAIIRDIPKNSHFVSALGDDRAFETLISLELLQKMGEARKEGNWYNMSSGDLTYVLLPSHLDGEWLTQQADAVFHRHAPESVTRFLTGVDSRRLQDMNLILWDAVGWPVIETISVLGFLVLLIAGLNYTNLATAQAFGRAKEVGLRKTMGANIRQLLSQFLIESIATALIAMVVALAMLEILIPLFNDATGKIVALNYVTYIPSLLMVTLVVGLVSGSYPSYIITLATPIDALKNSINKGGKGTFIRSTMIGAQFVFSIFMLAMVAVVFFQNQKIREGGNIFPKSEIVVLQKTWLGDIANRRDVLKQELSQIPGVEYVTYSSQVPFQQQNWTFSAAKNSGDEAGKVRINRIHVEFDFMKTFNIPLMLGRDFSREVANDLEKKESTQINVIVNETALKSLGFLSPQEALNQTFHQIYEDDHKGSKKSFVIIGIMPDQNFLGLHNSIKPIVLRVLPQYYEAASIRIKGGDLSQALIEIEKTWKKVIPDYPIQVEFLDEKFEEEFKIYRAINMALVGFAVIALTLAFIGLFGLAAFMAAQRTKEIGIRKVMGAETFQIVRLLIWQFSLPVIWALIIAVPLSFFASQAYLNFFADRIEFPILLIAASGLMAVLLSWFIVSVHAYRVSCKKPIYALRYE